MFFHEQDGTFNLSDVTAFTTLLVEGPPVSSPLPHSRSVNHSRSLTVSSTPPANLPPPTLPPPTFRSVVAQRRPTTFSLKVLKAKLTKNGRRKPEFNATSQTYIELVEFTANLEHILSVINRRYCNVCVCRVLLVSVDAVQYSFETRFFYGTALISLAF